MTRGRRLQLLVVGIGTIGMLGALAVREPANEEAVALPGPSMQSSQPLYGFGRAATEEEIAEWNIDVRPDGTGLPDGEGSVADGRFVYEQKCVVCHGSTGTEGPYNRLVGRVPGDEFPFANDRSVRLTIGNYWPYASTLFDYTLRAMPFDYPGSLTPDETYAVTAYLLFLNEIIAEDAVMNRVTLPEVRMPSENRFVRDDRKGGAEVR